MPGEPKELPAADAVIVAPATFNTVNKWATRIALSRPLRRQGTTETASRVVHVFPGRADLWPTARPGVLRPVSSCLLQVLKGQHRAPEDRR